MHRTMPTDERMREMPHDGQEPRMTSEKTETPILPDLLALTAGAVAPVEAVFETARTAIRERV